MVDLGPDASAQMGLPSTCPLCGQDMESGVMAAGMYGLASVIYWGTRSGAPIATANENSQLAYRLFRFAEIPGFRCTRCKVVIGRYPGRSSRPH